MKKLTKYFFALLLVGALYLIFWPVEVDPVAWDAPVNRGYVGEFSPNEKLANLSRIDIGEHKGPEDVAVGPDGRIYTPTHDGVILTFNPADGSVSRFSETGGRVLGIAFGPDGTLYAADAYHGLYAIDRSGNAKLVADKTDDGSPIPYADGVDVDSNGIAYFSDASTKFGAKANGGTLPASL